MTLLRRALLLNRASPGFAADRLTSAGRSDPSGRSAGIVVPAVLLTVLVTVLSLVAITNRVSSSRQEAAQGAMANAAKEAAEYGFSEIVAEMNRDVNSYLWVTKFANWSSVSQGDLAACGLAGTAASTFATSSATPVVIASNRYGTLSYQLKGYVQPGFANAGFSPSSVIPAGHPCRSRWDLFGNLIGGSGSLQIEGRSVSPSGQVSTYVLQRNVSVRGKPDTAAVLSLWQPSTSADLFASFVPSPPPKPTPDAGDAGDARVTLKAVAINGVKSISSSNYSVASEWKDACRLDSPNRVLRCWFTSLKVVNSGSLLKVEAIDSQTSIEFYLNGTGVVLEIQEGAALDGDSASLGRFRIYGSQSGSCTAATQEVRLGAANGQVNLLNAFLFFPAGNVVYGSSSTSATPRGLAGLACGTSFTTLSGAQLDSFRASVLAGTLAYPTAYFQLLGGPYEFAFAANANPPFRFFYRGVPFRESQ